MAPGVAGEENDGMAREIALEIDIGRKAKRRFQPDFAVIGKGGEVIEAAASDDANGWGRGHGCHSSRSACRLQPKL
jgi:hypothetical protein